MAVVLTSWQVRWGGDAPRLVTAYVIDKFALTMATVKHSIIENDVVALRERVGKWPAGTTGAAVSVHEDSALVEVADATTGVALDMFEVPAELLEVQPRTWLKP